MQKLIFLCALALCVCACKTQVVTVPQVRTEYVHDTVTEHLTDSILQTRYVYVKADTVHDVQIVERIKWRDKVQVQRVERTTAYRIPLKLLNACACVMVTTILRHTAFGYYLQLSRSQS